jgi:tRNA(Ile2) C34 agmatinyltransferase TiaS
MKNYIDYGDIVYMKTNREKARTPKKGKFWCPHCDRNYVSKGGKCSFCGKREPNKTYKKE